MIKLTNKKQQIIRYQINTWLELQNTSEDDKFPNTSFPCAHLETVAKKKKSSKKSNFPLRKQEEKQKESYHGQVGEFRRRKRSDNTRSLGFIIQKWFDITRWA